MLISLLLHPACLVRHSRIILGMALLFPLTLLASAGKIVIAQGEVYALDINNEQRSLARRSDVNEGDTLVTGSDGSLQIRFNDNAVLALSSDSQLRISEYHGRDADNNQEQILMDLLAGGFRTITGNIGSTDRDAYQVRTPNASIGIRGTHYEALLDKSNLLLGVYDGGIVVSNSNGTLNLGLGGSFLFGQVSTGSAPRGLLEPPTRLNQPLVPGTSQPGQPQPDDEPESQLSEMDEAGLALELAFSGNEPPPTIPQLTDEQTATMQLLLTELEDRLTELGQEAVSLKIPADVRLSIDQQAAMVEGPGKGFIVLTDSDGDAVDFVYRVEGDNGPVFINYDSESLTELDNGYLSPDRVYVGPPGIEPETLVTLERDDQTVEWGIWNASSTDPATLLQSSTSLANESRDTAAFFYVFAEPADLTSLTGTRYLELCGTLDCIDVFASDGTNLSSADGYMDVNLSDMTANSGLNMYMNDGSWWSLYFSSNIENSMVTADDLFIDSSGQGRDESSYNLADESEQFTDITGELQGLLINGENQSIEFVGGFGVASEAADQSISGVFLMSEEGN